MPMRLSSRLRWFWRIYIPVAAMTIIVMGMLAVGHIVEERFWPVRADQRMENITRSADRICWEWVSVKLRPIVSDNLDLFIDTADDHAVGAPFERDTGMPWARSRAVGVGPHRQAYCVLLPPNVRSEDRVRISQVAYYPGWLGLWRTAVRMPDVVNQGAPP